MAETKTAGLVERYLALGGRRRAVTDDNLHSTRLWDDEPEDAAQFWAQEIASLPPERLEEFESLLPTINEDKNP